MNEKILLGWREWIDLPDLGTGRILAKVDTGAKTCALHTYFIEPFNRGEEDWIRFGVHPVQGETETVAQCEARVIDRRDVTDSGGHTELRYVIETTICTGDIRFPAQITLTNRDNMKYRVLLGRNALRKRFIVDPSRSYLTGKQE